MVMGGLNEVLTGSGGKVFFDELFYYLANGGPPLSRFDLQPSMELLVHVHAQPCVALWHAARSRFLPDHGLPPNQYMLILAALIDSGKAPHNKQYQSVYVYFSAGFFGTEILTYSHLINRHKWRD